MMMIKANQIIQHPRQLFFLKIMDFFLEKFGVELFDLNNDNI